MAGMAFNKIDDLTTSYVASFGNLCS